MKADNSPLIALVNEFQNEISEGNRKRNDDCDGPDYFEPGNYQALLSESNDSETKSLASLMKKLQYEEMTMRRYKRRESI